MVTPTILFVRDSVTKTVIPNIGDATTTSLRTTVVGAVTLALYATKLDNASSTITYVGLASPGTLGSAAVWAIRRLNAASGLIVEWADGNSNFDNIWDNRAGLSYS